MNGFKAWGNNTAAYPNSTDPKDRWIPCRRMFTWWGNTLIQTYFQKVDNPMNRRLIENVMDSENIRGNSFVARGYVAGASVEFRDSDNPATDLLNGIIRFQINLAPFVPAENIEFILEFDTNALTNSIVGGE
jgi:phage tail sheath protein FI